MYNNVLAQFQLPFYPLDYFSKISRKAQQDQRRLMKNAVPTVVVYTYFILESKKFHWKS